MILRLTGLTLMLCAFSFYTAKAQDVATVSGSIQSDMLFPQSDTNIGAAKDGDFNTNTYIDVLMQSRHVDGQRFHAVQRGLQLLLQLRRGDGVQPPGQGNGQLGRIAFFLDVQHDFSS